MKQLLSIFLVILFAFPAWAQEGIITEIQKGQQAPFTGVLMDVFTESDGCISLGMLADILIYAHSDAQTVR